MTINLFEALPVGFIHDTLVSKGGLISKYIAFLNYESLHDTLDTININRNFLRVFQAIFTLDDYSVHDVDYLEEFIDNIPLNLLNNFTIIQKFPNNKSGKSSAGFQRKIIYMLLKKRGYNGRTDKRGLSKWKDVIHLKGRDGLYGDTWGDYERLGYYIHNLGGGIHDEYDIIAYKADDNVFKLKIRKM